MTTGVEIAIGAIVLAVFAMITTWRFRDGRRWARQADTLAREYDIALRPDVAVRVARYLRRQYLLSAASMIPVLLLLQLALPDAWDVARAHRHVLGYVLTVMALPSLTVGYCLVFALPAWNRARTQRVTHLVRPTPSKIFTRRESAALMVGVIVAVSGGYWGLWRVAAGWWWLGWAAASIGSVFVWWW